MTDEVPSISSSQDDPVQTERDKDLRWIKIGFYFFGAIAILGLLIYSLHYAASWIRFTEIIGAGLLIATASFMLGTLLGFVFAIPRALQGQRSDNQTDHSRSTPDYQVNTNLEQISDWLTKILVGVGLVQLGKVPEYARSLGRSLAPCLGDAPSSSAIGVILVLAFLVFGFLTGYLVTRLYVTGALKRAEGSGSKDVEAPSGINIGLRPEQIEVVSPPNGDLK
ncbi:MAG: hypothetical protein WCB56_11465 [Terriglobales bacterium]|jgi:ABC-type amino acid transport system permease subunit